MTDPNAPKKPRLSEEGQVYVTMAAAEDYLRGMPHLDGIEAARRELTLVAMDAYRTTEPNHARARVKRLGLDLSLRVSNEPPLIVIVGVHARDWNVGRGRR